VTGREGGTERSARRRAIIFDLDGVLATTDEYHYLAWKAIADREGIPFDRKANEAFRGVSRAACVDILVKGASRPYDEAERAELAGAKNARYQALLAWLTPAALLPGVEELLDRLEAAGVLVAVGSSSKNTKLILEKTGLAGRFDAVADGYDISRSKPDPEVFLVAARKLGVEPGDCAVVEDAEAGIDAALAAGMKAIGVGPASRYEKAEIRIPDLRSLRDLSLLLD
jgi:beta-phosphoglucomutase